MLAQFPTFELRRLRDLNPLAVGFPGLAHLHQSLIFIDPVFDCGYAAHGCLCTSTHSVPIAFYRPQADFSDGANDGKIETTRREFLVFQMLRRAGDD
jgi:hypothetical protein